ncbi:hypothetical protein RIF25_08470 [Thermosynechococcaceae cyanobacterium BACA0444]|uniref:Uncharacterized protein n=1 Tax=Pseudocalidococcus azoricus BACA0444 TaxID=2918990 RepID=A0AAE4JZH7_9CYAN|nr:hypothetical protein [Pseudocalidococcus azoricus]MDS3860847.1 hypothetical protein [Pseudocalidococcus azoricus BACA0444]
MVISIAFLRFYDERDFSILGIIPDPRIWSNRLTVAALLATLVNFGVEWNRRNRETDRLAREEQRRLEEKQRRVEEEQRRVEEEQRKLEEEQRERARRIEEKEQAARRARVEAERDIAFGTVLIDPSDENREKLRRVLAVIDEYKDNL